MADAFDRLTVQLTAALRAHLDGRRRVEVPEAGVALWAVFCELSDARTWHAHGPNPIGWAEIDAWSRLMRWPLQPRHVAAIRALDAAWVEHAHATLAAKRGDGGVKRITPSSGHAISPALFDAVMQ